MYIQQTEDTPFIIIEEAQGFILFKGKSVVVYAIDFYKPIIENIEKYVIKKPSDTKVIIDLDYFNTISSRIILEMFKILKKLVKKGFYLKIDWYYDEDDENMLECGQDFTDILGDIPFNLIPKR